MENRAYICPQCGGPLDLDPAGGNIAICPHCGSRVRIVTGSEDASLREFRTPDGVRLARARISESFETGGQLDSRWQSELIPYRAYIYARDRSGIALSSESKELTHDVRNFFIKTIIALVPNHVSAGYSSFEEPDDYIRRWAEGQSGLTLTETARVALPSYFGLNHDAAEAQLTGDIRRFDAFMEMSTAARSMLCESLAVRYTGTAQDGTEYVVLAGMDYEGAELVYGGDLFKGLNLDTKYVRAAKESVNRFLEKAGSANLSEIGSTISDVVSGREKLSMSDLMQGGLIGKAMRKKKEQAAAAPRQAVSEEPATENKEPEEEGPVPFGHLREHGTRIDQITFGAYRKYYCAFPKNREAEGTRIFLEFVTSIEPDPDLAQREDSAVAQKMSEIRQAVAQNQAILSQKQAQLRQMQMQTSQMISENSRRASAGLMDSWNRKMASDSYLSQARSEATRGVNTYTNSFGQNIEISTAADHVYENRYGDMYGVSGNAIDQDVLNMLDWKEKG